MGLFKKLKDTAAKGIEKGVELGTKGYDGTMEAAKKGYEKARDDSDSEQTNTVEQTNLIEQPKTAESTESIEKPTMSSTTKHTQQNISQSTQDALQILKLRYAKGEITKEQFEEMKKTLE